jgi:hypothetical protein
VCYREGKGESHMVVEHKLWEKKSFFFADVQEFYPTSLYVRLDNGAAGV